MDGLAATAVEEIVRWASPIIFMRRTVARDTVLGGTARSPGDKVVLWYWSANRDECHFAEPERLTSMFSNGMKRLPVEFTPGPRRG